MRLDPDIVSFTRLVRWGGNEALGITPRAVRLAELTSGAAVELDALTGPLALGGSPRTLDQSRAAVEQAVAAARRLEQVRAHGGITVGDVVDGARGRNIRVDLDERSGDRTVTVVHHRVPVHTRT